jgi:hypothetical protein
LEVGADMGPWKKDYHHTLPFAVTNPKMDYKVGDRYYLDKEPDKKEGQPYLDLEFETKDDVVDELPKFKCGEIIKGRLKVGNTTPRVRRAIIELYSIEYARWGPTRTYSFPRTLKGVLMQTIPNSIGSLKPKSIY